MRFVAMLHAGLIGFAAIAAVAGCAPITSTDQAQACPPDKPWVHSDYANGKWVPGHCLGEAAQ